MRRSLKQRSVGHSRHILRRNPMRLLRELSRRKLRTTLTILGITIGIWALVVFGSMANKITALVEGGSEYYANKILVTDGSTFGTAPMGLESDRKSVV